MNHSKVPSIVKARATISPAPQNDYTEEDQMIMRLGFKNKMRVNRQRYKQDYTSHVFKRKTNQTSWHARGWHKIVSGLARFFRGKSYATKQRRAKNRQGRKSRQVNRNISHG